MLTFFFLQLVLLALFFKFLRYRGISLLDYSSIYIVLRLVPLVSVAIWSADDVNFSDTPSLSAYLSLFLYVATLVLLFPRAGFRSKYNRTVSDKTISVALNCAVFIVLLKVLIVMASLDSIPLFGNLSLGSDSYILFDMGNKWLSTLKIALGNIELFLLVFYWDSIKKKGLKVILILCSLMFTLLWLKKGALLSWFATIAIAEYLSIRLIKDRERVFIKRKNIVYFLILIFSWAIWVFSASHAFDIRKSLELIGLLHSKLTFIFSQPLSLMTSGFFQNFIDSYSVDRSLYFIHSITTVFGYPAFDLGPGVAIANWLTGNDTGNGINPTFLIEGYIVFGQWSFLYAISIALIQTAIFRFIFYNKNQAANVMLLVAMLYPLSFSLALDSSLALKRVVMGCAVLCVVYFVSRIVSNVKLTSSNL